jgi:hypothetical protein
MRYIIYSTVARIERRSSKVWLKGMGEHATFREEDLGWYVLLRGSYEALHVGYEEPTWKVGEKVKITLERTKDD